MFGKIKRKKECVPTVIKIDTYLSQIELRSESVSESAKYTDGLFSNGFFDELSEILESFVGKYQFLKSSSFRLILPDFAVCTDIITLPVMKKQSATDKAREIYLAGMYKNYDELEKLYYVLKRDNDRETGVVFLVRREILLLFAHAFSKAGLALTEVAFESDFAVQSVISARPELSDDAFLLMDIKDDSTLFAFAIGGNTVGFYHLPFGYSIIDSEYDESALFDHSLARRVLFEAKERAREKSGQTDDGVEDEGKTPSETESIGGFGIFVKWAHDLILLNDRITNISKINKVYVNIPERYSDLIKDIGDDTDTDIGFEDLKLYAKSGSTSIFGDKHIWKLREIV